MSVDVMRLWADRLRDATHGVNALLPTIPRDLADPVPPDVTIVEETQYFWSPGEKIPNKILEQEAPFLLLMRAAPEMAAALVGGAEVNSGNAEIDLCALYVGVASAAPGHGPHEVMRDAMQTLRAVQRSTAKWLEESGTAAYDARARNGTQIVRPIRSLHLNITADTKGAFVGGAYVAAFETTDRWAEGIT
jgi:hypothetical protein